MRTLKPARVKRYVARLDTGGKHGRPFTVGRVRDEPHVLVRLPVDQLDAIEPADLKRIQQYAARSTPIPPVLATYGEQACRRGVSEVFVWNGNHRVAAARLRGETSLRVLMPVSDWKRFRSCRIRK